MKSVWEMGITADTGGGGVIDLNECY